MADEATGVVRAELTLAGGQYGRCVVEAVRGREEVSRPFRYEVDLVSEEIIFDEARGKGAHLHLVDSQGHERHVHGVVEELSVLAGENREFRWRIVIIPMARLLSYRRGFRIFQDERVPEIVKTVFADAGLPEDAFDWSGVRDSDHRKRPLCVQYDESEWDFACRLLEDEGIWFTFVHRGDGCTMLLSSDSKKAPQSAPASIPFVFGESGMTGLRGWRLSSDARLCENAVELSDYDRMKPKKDLSAKADEEDAFSREHYEWPAGHETPDDGKKLARVRLDELRSLRRTTSLSTNAVFVHAGHRLAVDGCDVGPPELFVVAADVHVRIRDVTDSAPLVDAGPRTCDVRLTLVPAEQTFRPRRVTPKPRATGLQTARVTVPPGEEIHVDELGRIKVQFHWDLDGQLDEKSSCWIRVAQPYTTESVLHPRVGWEIVVEFLDGDPDRPVARGRLFNPFFPPHFSLPAEKTSSALRTTSLPGQDGINELVYVDTAGEEKVLLHGQHDWNTEVDDCKTWVVRNDETHSVGAGRKLDVGVDLTRHVVGNESKAISGEMKTTVSAMRSVEVSGNASESVKGGVTRTTAAVSMGTHSMAAKASLEKIKEKKIAVREGQKAEAAERKMSPILGPLAPAVKIAKKAVGNQTPTGPGAAVLGGGEGASEALAASSDADLSSPEVQEACDVAAAANARAMSGQMGADDQKTAKKKSKGGPGAWSVTVAGNVVETIGAAVLITSGGAYANSCGGVAVEIVGGLRIKAFGSGSASKSGGNAEENNGQTFTVAMNATKSVAEKGAQVNVGTILRQKIDGSHVTTIAGDAKVEAGRAKVQAQEKVVLTCGESTMVIDKDGVAIDAKEIVVEGERIVVEGAAIESA